MRNALGELIAEFIEAFLAFLIGYIRFFLLARPSGYEPEFSIIAGCR
jgi:hypothetical protein